MLLDIFVLGVLAYTVVVMIIAIDAEREAFNWVFKTDDAKAGILAFVNKEQADFSGS